MQTFTSSKLLLWPGAIGFPCTVLKWETDLQPLITNYYPNRCVNFPAAPVNLANVHHHEGNLVNVMAAVYHKLTADPIVSQGQGNATSHINIKSVCILTLNNATCVDLTGSNV